MQGAAYPCDGAVDERQQLAVGAQQAPQVQHAQLVARVQRVRRLARALHLRARQLRATPYCYYVAKVSSCPVFQQRTTFNSTSLSPPYKRLLHNPMQNRLSELKLNLKDFYFITKQ